MSNKKMFNLKYNQNKFFLTYTFFNYELLTLKLD